MRSIIKDKKSQSFFVGLMICIMVLITAVEFMPLLKLVIGTARDADHLDCANTSISMFTQMTCITTDAMFFYFFGVALSCSILYLYWRKSF